MNAGNDNVQCSPLSRGRRPKEINCCLVSSLSRDGYIKNIKKSIPACLLPSQIKNFLFSYLGLDVKKSIHAYLLPS